MTRPDAGEIAVMAATVPIVPAAVSCVIDTPIAPCDYSVFASDYSVLRRGSDKRGVLAGCRQRFGGTHQPFAAGGPIDIGPNHLRGESAPVLGMCAQVDVDAGVYQRVGGHGPQ